MSYGPCHVPDQVGTYRKDRHMPLVNVKLIEGVFTESQKKEMVEDVKSGDWGIGVEPLTTADVKALAVGASAA